MSETGKSAAAFNCPKCGGDTVCIGVMNPSAKRNARYLGCATYCANPTQGVDNIIAYPLEFVSFDVQIALPVFDSCACDACETEIDISGPVKASILDLWPYPTRLEPLVTEGEY